MSVSSGQSSSPTPLFSNSPASTRTSSLASSTLAQQIHDKSDTNQMEPEYAVAQVDYARISSTLAARLCCMVLDHTLYLNGQIPFPVQSLGKLNLDGKAARKRADLLSSLDVISSHLPSTFQSLSWALAMNPTISTPTNTMLAPTHLMLITGPSPTTAKARCIIELDGFEVNAYGSRNQGDDRTPTQKRGEMGSENSRIEETNLETTQHSNGTLREPTLPSETPGAVEDAAQSDRSSSPGERAADDEDIADASFTSFVSDVSEALSALSLSSATSSHSEASDDEGSSLADSSERSASEGEEGEEESDFDSESQPDFEDELDLAPQIAIEEEQHLRAAVRSLSLAMASACDFGRDSIPLSQTHIMLRAPRRFTHPSWLPKPLLKKMLDDRLFGFFDPPHAAPNARRPSRSTIFQEAVRVVPLAKEGAGEIGHVAMLREMCEKEARHALEDEEGEDGMIWWQWSATTLKGFADF